MAMPFLRLFEHKSLVKQLEKTNGKPKLETHALPLCCWWLIQQIQNDAKNMENDWNPGTWVLIW